MKDNATKPTKKRKLLTWLIIAACLLIIAAIIVGVVFAVNDGGQNTLTDPSVSDNDDKNQGGNTDDKDGNNDDKNPGGNTGDKDDKDPDDADVSTPQGFLVPVSEVNVTYAHEFGWDKTMKWYAFHEGMDFSAPAGTEVFAAMDGTVTSVIKDDLLDYAYVTISHADGYSTLYKFIDPDEGLTVGATVSRGQVIGSVAVAAGDENAEGDHLHFEILKNSVSVDPDIYLNITSK